MIEYNYKGADCTIKGDEYVLVEGDYVEGDYVFQWEEDGLLRYCSGLGQVLG